MHASDERFLELIRENDSRLRRICQVYAADPDTVEDLYQDILVQLWRSLPSFQSGSHIDTWVYRVALNTAMSHRRQRDARPETSLAGGPDRWASSHPAPDQDLLTRERRARLHAAIRQLGEIDRALVTLYLDERSYREMAAVLGISESNVGVKLHRIRKQLAARMTEEVQ